MATIQSLHDLVTTNETQNGAADRITGAEVRAVDNAVVNEIATRGTIVVNATTDLATIPAGETKNALVPSVGLFTLITSGVAPDNFNTFPSITAGVIWLKVAVKLPQQWNETITNKAQHAAITKGNADIIDTFIRIQYGFWNGTAFVAGHAHGLGYGALQNNTGDACNAVGTLAMANNTGVGSNGFGNGALINNLGSFCVALGDSALASNTKDYSIGIGKNALFTNLGDTSIGIGKNAGQNNSGDFSIGIGNSALNLNTGVNCIAIGTSALEQNHAPYSVGIGVQALQLCPVTTAGLVGIGYSAGQNNTGDSATLVGYAAGQNNTGANAIALGPYALQGNTGAYAIGIGYNSLINNHGNYAVAMGQSSMDANTGHFCTGIGFTSLQHNTRDSVTGFGFSTLQDNTGINSSALGWGSGNNNNGDYFTACGYASGYNNIGNGVSAFGFQSLIFNNSPNVTAFGFQSDSQISFVNNAATVKNFASANFNVGAQTITVTAHGFGATGTGISLRFLILTGTAVAFSNNQVYKFQIIDANTLKHPFVSSGAGAGTYSLQRDIDRTNSTWIGANAFATKANQIMLGDNNIVEVAFFGKINMLSGTTTAPSNTTTPASWANILMNGVNYKIALYS